MDLTEDNGVVRSSPSEPVTASQVDTDAMGEADICVLCRDHKAELVTEGAEMLWCATTNDGDGYFLCVACYDKIPPTGSPAVIRDPTSLRPLRRNG